MRKRLYTLLLGATIQGNTVRKSQLLDITPDNILRFLSKCNFSVKIRWRGFEVGKETCVPTGTDEGVADSTDSRETENFF